MVLTHQIRSKLAGENGEFSRSPCSTVARAVPSERAASTCAVDRSMPTTAPSAPTADDSHRSASPVPQPASSTRAPALRFSPLIARRSSGSANELNSRSLRA
jgi:hypothetical protein